VVLWKKGFVEERFFEERFHGRKVLLKKASAEKGLWKGTALAVPPNAINDAGL
jgi:hypothetical protein